jgi:hypothetical protein
LPERMPRRNAIPRRATSSGSPESDLSPITGLPGLLSTSRTGAKLMSMPTAESSAARTTPAASAALAAWQQNRE